MGSGASKASSKASTPRKESEEPVSSAVEPTSEPVSEPISEPEPASEPVSEPISAPTEAADEAQTAEEVSQVNYFGFIRGPRLECILRHKTIQLKSKQNKNPKSQKPLKVPMVMPVKLSVRLEPDPGVYFMYRVSGLE